MNAFRANAHRGKTFQPQLLRTSVIRRVTALLLCAGTALVFSACGKQTGSVGSSSAGSSAGAAGSAASGGEKIKVSVSFNAMKELTEAVGKDKVEITTIIPDGTEPHDFDPKPKDLTALSSADVFVYSGLGMEAWADKAVQAAGNSGLVTVEASKGAEAIENTDPGEIKEHGKYDPHIWLSLKGAELETKNIRDGLVKADAADKEFFDKNCDEFVSQLESLYSDYSTKFKSAKRKSFVTGHAAFAYLCRDFGLTQNSVEDTFAEGEPSAQKLSELVDYCKKNDVKTIFVEEMVSPSVSQTLAKEVGAKVETIYTVESGEEGKSYLDRVKANLQEIADSLNQ